MMRLGPAWPSIGPMPVAVRIAPQHMSKADYDRVIAELEASGASEPEGRLFHAAYGDDDDDDDEVHIFEVWESPEQFEAHRDKTFATLQASTVGATVIEIHQLHSPRPD